MNRALASAALVMTSAALIEAGPISPAVVNPANGHTYYLLETDTWTGSHAQAIQLGGRLATIDNQAEQQWIFASFGGYGGQPRLLWIGLTDAAQEGAFTWTSGGSLNFANWATGEPNNSSAGENYVAIYYPGHDAGGRWNDWDDRAHDPIGLPFNGVVEIEPAIPLSDEDFQSLKDGLVAAYHFNNNTLDHSGNGNHATGQNFAFAFDRFGEPAAAAFIQQSAVVIAPSSPSLDIHGQTSLSVSAWVNLGSALEMQTIASKWGGGGDEDDQFHLGIALGRVRFLTDDEPTEIYSQTRLAEGEPTHIAAIYDHERREIAIYIDGALDNAKPLLHPIRSTTQPVFIGNAAFEPQPLQGSLDDLLIYNRALRPAEVRALHQLQSSKRPRLEFLAPNALRMEVTPGASYELQISIDLAAWTKFGETIVADAQIEMVTIPTSANAAFFRLRQL